MRSNWSKALAEALKEAIIECEKHNDDYHHRTSMNKICSWNDLLLAPPIKKKAPMPKKRVK